MIHSCYYMWHTKRF